jgi:hypothetical protein
MNDSTVDLGTQDVKVAGNALAVKLPQKWLVTHELKLGDPLYSVRTMAGEIKLHLKPTDWAKKVKIRKPTSTIAAYVTINAQSARELGIEQGSIVSLRASMDDGILTIRKVEK